MARKRFEKYHMIRVQRLLTRECVAQELGGEACWMLMVILGLQHVTEYRRPVTFYNGQLMSLLGIHSEKKLARIRQSAIE